MKNLIIVSAPSGTGKTTICKVLQERDKTINFSVSCTTRKPRAGEKDGVDYKFMDTKEFKVTMDEWINMITNSRPAEGHDRVMYPGLPEQEAYDERSQIGIPLHTEVVEWFRDISAELSIPFVLL